MIGAKIRTMPEASQRPLNISKIDYSFFEQLNYIQTIEMIICIENFRKSQGNLFSTNKNMQKDDLETIRNKLKEFNFPNPNLSLKEIDTIFKNNSILNFLLSKVDDKFSITDPDNLIALANNFHIIKDIRGQRRIVQTILDDSLGAHLKLRKALLSNMHNITSTGALWDIAEAVKAGKFDTTDPDNLIALANNFHIINDNQAQWFIIAESILNISLEAHPELVKALVGNMHNITDLRTQMRILEAIFNGNFVITEDIIPALANSLNKINDIQDLLDILKTIFSGKIAINPDTRKAVANNLHNIKTAGSQVIIAKAIGDGELGADPKILTILATNLLPNKITNGVAQTLIVLSITEGKFGRAIEDVIDVANNLLPKIIDIVAQNYIMDFISKVKFGTNTETLTAWAENLHKITNIEIQRLILKKIFESGGTPNPEILINMVNNLLSKTTDVYIQQAIAVYIERGKFGTNPKILIALAKSVRYITNPIAQDCFAMAIFNGKFGTDPRVLKAVANNVCYITSQVALKVIARAIREGKLPYTEANVQNTLKIIIENSKNQS